MANQRLRLWSSGDGWCRTSRAVLGPDVIKSALRISVAGPCAFSGEPWLNYPPLISEEPRNWVRSEGLGAGQPALGTASLHRLRNFRSLGSLELLGMPLLHAPRRNVVQRLSHLNLGSR